MNTTHFRRVALGTLLLSGAACSDYLTTDSTSRDPNRPSTASSKQLFVGIQTNTWAVYGSDLSRIAAMFDQQAIGLNAQYVSTYNYSITSATTNGQQVAFYAAGGLVDIRNLQKQARAQQDFKMLGVGQILEGVQMSLAADVFGDLVYSKALEGGNPPLDKQLDIYNALLAKLDSGITNVQSTAITSVGPQAADLVYGGSTAKWVALAHTIKARIYMHLGKVSPATAYPSALAEAALGINDPTFAGDYVAVYSGNAGEMNLLYQFVQVQRPGYISPNPLFITFADTGFPAPSPRLAGFVDSAGPDGFNAVFVGPTTPQVVASFDENSLIWAEAAFRTGNPAVAQTQLNNYRAAHGIPTQALAGNALLEAILNEKYVALFMQVEAYNDYKRNCWPNLTPVVPGLKIPGRLKYDANEQQTNPNIPPPNAQPARNQNDPAATTTPFGTACLGQ